jgi:hypothetical protein
MGSRCFGKRLSSLHAIGPCDARPSSLLHYFSLRVSCSAQESRLRLHQHCDSGSRDRNHFCNFQRGLWGAAEAVPLSSARSIVPALDSHGGHLEICQVCGAQMQVVAANAVSGRLAQELEPTHPGVYVNLFVNKSEDVVKDKCVLAVA